MPRGYSQIEAFREAKKAEAQRRDMEKKFPIIHLKEDDKITFFFLDPEPYTCYVVNPFNAATGRFGQKAVYETLAEANQDPKVEAGLAKPKDTAYYEIVITEFKPGAERLAYLTSEKAKKAGVDVKKWCADQCGKTVLLEIQGQDCVMFFDRHSEKPFDMYNYIFSRTGQKKDTRRHLIHDEKNKLPKKFENLPRVDFEDYLYGGKKPIDQADNEEYEAALEAVETEEGEGEGW